MTTNIGPWTPHGLKLCPTMGYTCDRGCHSGVCRALDDRKRYYEALRKQLTQPSHTDDPALPRIEKRLADIHSVLHSILAGMHELANRMASQKVLKSSAVPKKKKNKRRAAK